MPLFIFLLGLDQCLKGPLSSDFSRLYRLVCINTTGDPLKNSLLARFNRRVRSVRFAKLRHGSRFHRQKWA